MEVASRTWPGMNRPGGVGRIMQTHTKEVSLGGENDDGQPANNESNATSSNASIENSPNTNAKKASRVIQVDVKYVIGGTDKEVPVEFVKHAPKFEDKSISGNDGGGVSSETKGRSLRDRSDILGRCS